MQAAVKTSTFSERLDYIWQACGYPTPTSFTKALGLAAQNIGNWRERESVGKSGSKIRELTGANIDWLESGRGVPFPDGPIPYKGTGAVPPTMALIINRLENDVDQLRLALSAVYSVIAEMRPDAIEPLRVALLAGVPAEYARRGFHATLLRMLDEALPAEAKARPAARQRGAS